MVTWKAVSKHATWGSVGPQGLQAEDGGDGRRVVERGQLGELFEPALDGRLEKERARELEASVHDAVPDGIDGGSISQGLLAAARRSHPAPASPGQTPRARRRRPRGR